jgi:hypothetical protein
MDREPQGDAVGPVKLQNGHAAKLSRRKMVTPKTVTPQNRHAAKWSGRKMVTPKKRHDEKRIAPKSSQAVE